LDAGIQEIFTGKIEGLGAFSKEKEVIESGWGDLDFAQNETEKNLEGRERPMNMGGKGFFKPMKNPFSILILQSSGEDKPGEKEIHDEGRGYLQSLREHVHQGEKRWILLSALEVWKEWEPCFSKERGAILGKKSCLKKEKERFLISQRPHEKKNHRLELSMAAHNGQLRQKHFSTEKKGHFKPILKSATWP